MRNVSLLAALLVVLVASWIFFVGGELEPKVLEPEPGSQALGTQADDPLSEVPRVPGVAEEVSEREPQAPAAEPSVPMSAQTLRSTPEEFVVQVVDARGDPAIGVEVAWGVRRRGDSGKLEDRSSAVTLAPDGIAHLERGGEEDILKYFQMMGETPERVVFCKGPFLEPPLLALPEGPVEDLLRLQLEPTGGLDVSVVGPQGEAIPEGAAVQLSWTRPGEQERDGFRWLTVEGGRAGVNHIACGLELSLGASVRDSFFVGVSQELAGPRTQGQRVRALLRFDEQYPVLAGRLVDAEGQPVVNQRFSLEWDYSEPDPEHTGGFRFRGGFHSSDGEGAFALPWRDADWSRPLARGVRILRFVEVPPRGGKPAGWVARYAEVTPPAHAQGKTRYLLGDVELGPIPLLVEGQVVDEEGQPMPEVFVEVRYQARQYDDLVWVSHSERPYSDEEGRFSLRTYLPYEQIAVYAWRTRAGRSQTVIVPVGTRDVRLVYVPPDPDGKRGALKGALQVDEGIPWAGLEMRLRRQDAAGRKQSTLPWGGAFAFERLLPGIYSLELVSDGHGYCGPPFVHAREEDLVVQAGRETVVPSIDQRGRLRLFDVLLLDSEGERIDRETCSVRTESVPHPAHRGGWVYDGRLTFVAPEAVDSVSVAVGHHEPVEIRWSPERQTVTLD